MVATISTSSSHMYAVVLTLLVSGESPAQSQLQGFSQVLAMHLTSDGITVTLEQVTVVVESFDKQWTTNSSLVITVSRLFTHETHHVKSKLNDAGVLQTLLQQVSGLETRSVLAISSPPVIVADDAVPMAQSSNTPTPETNNESNQSSIVSVLVVGGIGLTIAATISALLFRRRQQRLFVTRTDQHLEMVQVESWEDPLPPVLPLEAMKTRAESYDQQPSPLWANSSPDQDEASSNGTVGSEAEDMGSRSDTFTADVVSDISTALSTDLSSSTITANVLMSEIDECEDITAPETSKDLLLKMLRERKQSTSARLVHMRVPS